MLLFVASMMAAQASNHALNEVNVPGPQAAHQYADENFLVELGITREDARILARDVAKIIAKTTSSFIVRPLNPIAADISNEVCLEADSAGHSASFLVDKGCDSCNAITRWWRR